MDRQGGEAVNTILVNLIVRALQSQQVQDAVGDFISRVVTEKLLPLLPIAAAAAAKAVTDQLSDISDIVDVADIANTVRDRLNEAIPDLDFGIPTLDDLMDFWRPKP
jgi:hypothetical protein